MNAKAAIVIVLLYVLHQDFWFFRSARPLVLGFLPVGLFYHAAFTLGCSLVLWWLATAQWPSHLEERAEGSRPKTPLSPAE
jgi:hypothetical protein